MGPKLAWWLDRIGGNEGSGAFRCIGIAAGIAGVLAFLGTTVWASDPEAPSAEEAVDGGVIDAVFGAQPDRHAVDAGPVGLPARGFVHDANDGGANGDGMLPDGPVLVEPSAPVVLPPSLRRGGMGVDMGLSGPLPDLGLLALFRPLAWLTVNLGAGYNGIAPGLRGGATVVNPFVVPLSLTFEAGHYFEGDANRYVRWVSSGTQEIASLRRFSYSYLNLMGGAEYVGKRFGAYLRVGVSWMRTTVVDFDRSVREITNLDLQADDPRISYRGPTAKLGTYIFF